MLVESVLLFFQVQGIEITQDLKVFLSEKKSKLFANIGKLEDIKSH